MIHLCCCMNGSNIQTAMEPGSNCQQQKNVIQHASKMQSTPETSNDKHARQCKSVLQSS